MLCYFVASGDHGERRLILFQQYTLMQMHNLDAIMVCRKFKQHIFRFAYTFYVGNNKANTVVVSNALYSSVESKSQPSKLKKGLRTA